MKLFSYFFLESFTGAIFILLFAVLYFIDNVNFTSQDQDSVYYPYLKGIVVSIGFFFISISLIVWRIFLFIEALFFK